MGNDFKPSGYNRRQDDSTIQVVADRLNSLHDDVGEIRTSLTEAMREVSTSFTKLVQIEERQVSTNQAIERALRIAEKAHSRLDTCEDTMQSKLDILEARIDELEKAQPMQKQVTDWVLKALWACVGFGLYLAGKYFGII